MVDMLDTNHRLIYQTRSCLPQDHLPGHERAELS